jgi:hypothetical protein
MIRSNCQFSAFYSFKLYNNIRLYRFGVGFWIKGNHVFTLATRGLYDLTLWESSWAR